MGDPTVYVLLPVHNRRSITAAFVKSLAGQTYRTIHLVLIDDGSTDDTAATVRDIMPDATVLKGDGSLWWGGSLQKGFDYLEQLPAQDTDIALICNDDVEMDERFVEAGVRLIIERPNSLLLAQHRSGQDARPSESGLYFDSRHGTFDIASRPEKINCLSTRGLFTTWSTAKSVGGFHITLLPHYGSDYEWTIRAHRKGFHLWTHPDVSLAPMLEETGLRWLDNGSGSFSATWRRLFSRHSTSNLFMRSMLFGMTADRLTLPIILCKLWARGLSQLVKDAAHALFAILSPMRKS